MPLFMDVHKMDGPLSVEDVAKAHAADVGEQGEYGVGSKRYWVDENGGRIFCWSMPRMPTPLRAVHREAHGLVADEIFEVSEHS